MSPEQSALIGEEENVSTGLFCVADQKVQADYTYVGEGKGNYTQQQVYNFAGEQRGSFDRHEVKSYSNWRPRLCTMVFLAIATVGLASYALAQYLASSSSSSTVAGGAGSCGEQDCMCGFSTGWSDQKKTWCCQNHGMGCPPDNSLQPFANVGKLVSPLQGCATKCELKGVSADCASRVKFASKEEASVKMSPNKCQAAFDLVKQQCLFCSLCPLESTGCAATSYRLFEMHTDTVLP